MISKRWVWGWVMVGVVCWAGVGVCGPSTAAKVKRAVAQALAETAEKAGVELQVVGVGSWVSGKSYKDPLLHPSGFSDHDMRLVVPPDLPPAKVKALWAKFKDNLRQALRREGVGSERVLKSVNVYPPEVLMEGVRDEAGALKRLKAMGQGVNLAGEAKAEGLYGPGAKRWIREAEAKEGVVFTRTSSGRVVQVKADITGAWGDVVGGPTLRGLADNADQLLLKAYKELAEANPSKALKQLKRMKAELARARVHSGMRLKFNLGPLNELIEEGTRFNVSTPQGLEEFTRWFEANRARLVKAMDGARVNVELLRRYAAATNPATRRLIEGMVEGQGGSLGRLRRALGKGLKRYGAKFVSWALTAIAAVGAVAQAGALGEAAQKEGLRGLNQQAVRLFGEEVAGLAGVVVGIGLDMAKEGLIGMAVAQQDCRDILGGVCRVWGHAALMSPIDPKQMAVRCRDPYKAQAFIRARINRLVAAGAARYGRVEEGLAEKLEAKCLVPLMRVWQAERERLAEGVLKAWKDLEAYMRRPLVLDYSGRVVQQGEGIGIVVRVRGALAGGLEGLGERLSRLLRAAQVLDPKAKLRLSQRYTWWVGGKRLGERRYESVVLTPGQRLGFAARVWRAGKGGMKEAGWAMGSGLPLRGVLELMLGPGQEVKVGLKWVLGVRLDTSAPEFALEPDMRPAAMTNYCPQGCTRKFSFGPMTMMARAELGPLEIVSPRQMVSGSGAVVRARLKGVELARLKALEVRWWLHTPSGRLGPKPGVEACVKPVGKGKVRLVAELVHTPSRRVLARATQEIEVLALEQGLAIAGPGRLEPGQVATYSLKGPRGFTHAWGLKPKWLVKTASGLWKQAGNVWYQAVRAGATAGRITLKAELWSRTCSRNPQGGYATTAVKVAETVRVVQVSTKAPGGVVRVVDKATGRPIAGARVVLRVGKASISLGSDSSGRCRFAVAPGTYSFAATAAGYTGVTGRVVLGEKEAVVALRRAGKPGRPSKTRSKRRGRQILLASFSGFVGGGGAKHMPDYQTRHSLELPGPGSLKLVMRLYPNYKCHVKYGTGCRLAARLSWSSPRSVAGGGRFYGGGTYRLKMANGRVVAIEDLREVVSYKVIPVRGPGRMEIRFRGEGCWSCKGRKSCCCFCCNWWWQMPAGYKIEAWFTPEGAGQ